MRVFNFNTKIVVDGRMSLFAARVLLLCKGHLLFILSRLDAMHSADHVRG